MLGAAALVAAGAILFDRAPVPPPARPLARIYPETVAPHSASGALRDLNMRSAADAGFDDWIALSAQASRTAKHARLSGQLDDFVTAGALLQTAFAKAGPGAGPHAMAASWALSVHRLGEATTMLDAIDRYAVPVAGADRADADAMRGDVAFYSGRYAEAYAYWMRAGGPDAQAVRLALHASKTGNPRRALALLDHALRAGRFITAQAAGHIAYQRGLIALQTGQWPEAEKAFASANAQFPGYWPYLQALGQSYALRGDDAGAIGLYQAAIARAQHPETMDALAVLYRHRGDRANADRWSARAASIWNEWLIRLPEAAYAHALDHELAFGDPRRALRLAAANWRARPYGASAVALGWALIANGDAALAARLMAALNRTEWVSAEQHIVAARAYATLGQSDAAARETAAARALNPRIDDPAAALIWIGH